MKKQPISTNNAPAAVGPYSQGIIADGTIYVSGQLPIPLETGEMVTDDIQKAVTACLSNVKAIVEAGGGNIDSIVKVTMFLADMNDFAKANEAYSEFFKVCTAPPSRSCFQVACLPKSAIVEVEAIALVD